MVDQADIIRRLHTTAHHHKCALSSSFWLSPLTFSFTSNALISPFFLSHCSDDYFAGTRSETNLLRAIFVCTSHKGEFQYVDYFFFTRFERTHLTLPKD
jgi:hypothetical protein